MFIEEYPEAEGEEEAWRHHDPSCERLDTAIKAIWLLYRRARWTILEELLGLPRSELERIFGQFDMRYVASDHGKLRSETQCFALLRMFNMEVEEERRINRYKTEVVRRRVNPLLAAAFQLVSDYMWVFSGSRKVNHGRPREQSGGDGVPRKG